jgi:hypothetical protein
MVALCNALKKNVHMSSTLVHLDISHNKLDADGSSALAAFLANPNQLRVLLMADCAGITIIDPHSIILFIPPTSTHIHTNVLSYTQRILK